MAKKKERTELKKSNWIANFELVGKAVINDYTFALDQHSEKSDWVWNRMNLLVDCGEKHGRVGCSLMGGYGINRDNVIYVHGKDESGRDDFSNFYTIDYEDRFDESILRDIGNSCFKTVALETDTKDKIVTKRFLSDKDMIEYINDVIEDEMVVYVKGNLNYQLYNGNINVEKNINYIGLSRATEENFRANFRQTVLLDRDCVDEVDSERKVVTVGGYVLEKFREFNGWDLTEGGSVKGGKFVPLRKTFEYDFSHIDADKAKKAIQYLFKIKKDVNQVTFVGHFVESSALVPVTEDDIPDDIKELIDIGVMTMEEAMTDCVDSTRNKDYKMVFERPLIRKITDDDGNVTNTVQMFEGAYEDEDLELECLTEKEVEDDESIDIPFSADEMFDDDDDTSWLDDLG